MYGTHAIKMLGVLSLRAGVPVVIACLDDEGRYRRVCSSAGRGLVIYTRRLLCPSPNAKLISCDEVAVSHIWFQCTINNGTHQNPAHGKAEHL